MLHTGRLTPGRRARHDSDSGNRVPSEQQHLAVRRHERIAAFQGKTRLAMVASETPPKTPGTAKRGAPPPAVVAAADLLPADVRELTRDGDLLLKFSTGEVLPVHSDLLRIASRPLMLALPARTGGSEPSAKAELQVEESVEDWAAALPFLYPSYAEEQGMLSWVSNSHGWRVAACDRARVRACVGACALLRCPGHMQQQQQQHGWSGKGVHACDPRTVSHVLAVIAFPLIPRGPQACNGAAPPPPTPTPTHTTHLPSSPAHLPRRPSPFRRRRNLHPLQTQVKSVLGIAHKYDMRRLLGACRRFLLEPKNVFSACRGQPNYLLAWLEVADRLGGLDDVIDRCTSAYERRRAGRRGQCTA